MNLGTGPVGVGVIGTGMISATYLDNMTRFPDLKVLAVGDLNTDLARSRAEQYDIAVWGTADDVLNHPDVELIVNLTVPAVHATIARAAVAAGKHVWSEKPISVDREEGRALLQEAAASRLLVGVAPDTVLGPAVQTALRAITRGDIGEPLSAQTVLQYSGPELFHPNPAFLFSRGAGPVFDIGPYYLTSLVHVFGSIKNIAAVGITARRTRTVQVGEHVGTDFPVEVPTHVSAIANFVDGGVSQSLFSFDSPLTRMGYVEITGSEGTMVFPDPNKFAGQVRITRAPTYAALHDEPKWEIVPTRGVHAERGLGVLDLARASRTGGNPIASGEVGYHVLDALVAIDDSLSQQAVISLSSRIDRPPLLPEGFDPYAALL